MGEAGEFRERKEKKVTPRTERVSCASVAY